MRMLSFLKPTKETWIILGAIIVINILFNVMLFALTISSATSASETYNRSTVHFILGFQDAFTPANLLIYSLKIWSYGILVFQLALNILYFYFIASLFKEAIVNREKRTLFIIIGLAVLIGVALIVHQIKYTSYDNFIAEQKSLAVDFSKDRENKTQEYTRPNDLFNFTKDLEALERSRQYTTNKDFVKAEKECYVLRGHAQLDSGENMRFICLNELEEAKNLN